MSGFEDRAAPWIQWARWPLDAYWFYRDAFFELVPPPPRRTLEVGCGEGRVARDLSARGYDVVGLDASETLVAAARAEGGEFSSAARRRFRFRTRRSSSSLPTTH